MTFLTFLGAVFVLLIIFFFPRTIACIIFLYALTKAGIMEYGAEVASLQIVFFIFWLSATMVGFTNDFHGLGRTLEIFKNKKAKETKNKG